MSFVKTKVYGSTKRMVTKNGQIKYHGKMYSQLFFKFNFEFLFPLEIEFVFTEIYGNLR